MNETNLVRELEPVTKLRTSKEVAETVRDVCGPTEDLILARAKDGTILLASRNKYINGFAITLQVGPNRYSINGCKSWRHLPFGSIIPSANAYIQRFNPQ